MCRFFLRILSVSFPYRLYGAVTEIPETTDFMGIGLGEAQDVVVGNLGKSVNPQAAAAWSVAGAQLWRRDDLVLDHSAVGGAWAVD